MNINSKYTEAITKIREINNNGTDIQKIQESADILLNTTGYTDIPIKIVELARDLGFRCFKADLPDGLHGFIAVDSALNKKFNSSRVILINENDGLKQKRFTIAHELARYIFDFRGAENSIFYSEYTNKSNIEKDYEKRAYYFAMCLLAPKNEFINKYNEIKNKHNYSEILSNYFQINEINILKRIIELKEIS